MERRTKIVATLGPASSSPTAILALADAGVDVFRLNFSHGSHEDHGANVAAIRRVEKQVGWPIGVMLDLQGPKLRIGTFHSGRIKLPTKAVFRLDLSDEQGDERRVALPHPAVFEALRPDAELLLDDGRIRLRVQRCGPEFAETIVLNGGELSDRKGVNLPGVVVPSSPLTEKDLCDLEFGLDCGVDWVALSFVQRPEDVMEARRRISGRAGIISKIEKPAALSRFGEIVALSDAIMIARGDLGIELSMEEVPSVQKGIVRECRRLGKPVIVATQMLDSMVKEPLPTRAEASDVATAVYEGADAVMLSAESATGRYPVESVTMMDRIIRRVEGDALYRDVLEAVQHEPAPTVADAMSVAARQVAQTIGATAIVAYTSSGSTTLRVARERPGVPVLGITPAVPVARRLTLAWGVRPRVVPDMDTPTEMVDVAERVVASQFVSDGGGQSIVIVAGVPFGQSGSTNLIRVSIGNGAAGTKCGAAGQEPMAGHAGEARAVE